MVESLKKTVRTAGRYCHQRPYASDLVDRRLLGVRGLFDGISGTWMRQMSYSVCRFWAYDESKKLLGAGMWCSTPSLYAVRLLVLRSLRPPLEVGAGRVHGCVISLC